jgi:hypothetical protein
MNPYLSFGLAMCAIVFISLACTGYLAVYFNRRARQDLEAALAPLAEIIDGIADAEEARVSGRYRGHIAEGRVALLPGGMGRVFQTSIIDGAGGKPWEWTVSRSKDTSRNDDASFKVQLEGVTDRLQSHLLTIKRDRAVEAMWFRVEYDPAAGHLRLTQPMRTRRDIPASASFSRFLEYLYETAAENRARQGPEADRRI